MSSNFWEYVRRVAPSASQREIAERLGISDSTVSRWRYGSMRPTPTQATALARAYGRTGTEGLVAAGYLTESDIALLIEEAKTERAPLAS